MIGTVILERYVIEKPLGKGGMGEVFLGRHSSLSLPVAIKIIHKSAAGHAVRLEREAMAMARVRHVNVVSIVDFGFHEHFPCIVMEYIEGESLAARRQRQYYLPWPYAFELGAQILEGLAAVHRAGLVHRDVKPENIMLTAGRPEIAKVVDFGIAKLEDPELRRLTNTGITVGTPGYMPPEQLAAASVSSGTDIYSLATTLWEAIEGRLPFGEGVRDLTDKLTKTPPPPRPPPPHPELTPQAQKLLASMLEPDMARRPADAAACADALRRAASEFRDSIASARSGASQGASRPAAPSHGGLSHPSGTDVRFNETRGDKTRSQHRMPVPPRSDGRNRPPAPAGSRHRRVRPSLTYSQSRNQQPVNPESESHRRAPSGHDARGKATVGYSAVRADAVAASAPPAIASPVSASSVQPLDVAPASAPDAGPLVIVARLPAAALGKPEQRRWLAQQLATGARSYTLGGNFWLVAEPWPGQDTTDTATRVQNLRTTLTERFGAIVRVEGQRAGPTFALTPATLSGAAPMPEPIASLLATLATSDR